MSPDNSLLTSLRIPSEELKTHLISLRMRRITAALISALLIVLAYQGIDFSRLMAMLKRVSLQAAVLIVALYVLSQVISAIKWRLFLQAAGFRRTTLETIEAYFAGMFVNSFGLGTIGGDAARSVLIRPKRGERSIALGTVIADRLHGLFVLICIALIGLSLSGDIIAGVIATTLAISAAVALLLLWYSVVWCRGSNAFQSLISATGGFGSLLSKSASAIPKQHSVVLQATCVSTAAHLFQILMHIAVAHQLGIDLPLVYFLAIVPLASIVSSLPITVSGLGVREALFVAWLTPLGVAHEAAVALGAICLLVVSLVSALGGLWSARRVRDELLTGREISPSRVTS